MNNFTHTYLTVITEKKKILQEEKNSFFVIIDPKTKSYDVLDTMLASRKKGFKTKEEAQKYADRMNITFKDELEESHSYENTTDRWYVVSDEDDYYVIKNDFTGQTEDGFETEEEAQTVVDNLNKNKHQAS